MEKERKKAGRKPISPLGAKVPLQVRITPDNWARVQKAYAHLNRGLVEEFNLSRVIDEIIRSSELCK